MNLRLAASVVAMLLASAFYVNYFFSIFRKNTKPHVYTWSVWAFISFVSFFAQLARGAGSGAGVTLVNGLAGTVVFAIAIRRGEQHITTSDRVCLLLSFIGIAGWIFTRNPLIAVVFSCAVDIFAIIPTIRKSYAHPFEESALSFMISLSAYPLQLVALQSFNPTTALLPLTIVIDDSVLIIVIVVRRYMISRSRCLPKT